MEFPIKTTYNKFDSEDDYMKNPNRSTILQHNTTPTRSVKKRSEHGHKNCPYSCQCCTDERKRCKQNKKKKARHGRIQTDTNDILVKGKPRELSIARPEGFPYIEHPFPPASKYCGDDSGDDSDCNDDGDGNYNTATITPP